MLNLSWTFANAIWRKNVSTVLFWGNDHRSENENRVQWTLQFCFLHALLLQKISSSSAFLVRKASLQCQANKTHGMRVTSAWNGRISKKEKNLFTENVVSFDLTKFSVKKDILKTFCSPMIPYLTICLLSRINSFECHFTFSSKLIGSLTQIFLFLSHCVIHFVNHFRHSFECFVGL